MSKTFKEWIAHQYDEATQQIILNAIPHGNVLLSNIPPELEFLRGFVDFGFENLGLPTVDFQQLLDGFADNGVAIPNTQWKIRYKGGMGVVAEPIDVELVLPNYWKQAVYVVNATNQYTWIGKLVRLDQLGVDIDFSNYRDVGDGWELKDSL